VSGPHLALISPYDAGNLGDAAILESVSNGFRALDPSCRFTAVTLAPAAMPDCHGFPGWPITGASVAFYAIAESARQAPASAVADFAVTSSVGSETPARRRSFAARLGRLPVLGPLLKRLRSAVRFAIADLRHWRRSHAWLADVDGVMVAGGGQFDDEWGGAWGHPYALFKWSVLAGMRGIPFVIASVGVCRTHDRLARFFFARAMRNAQLLTFRDAESRVRAAAIQPKCPGGVVSDLAFALDPAFAIHPALKCGAACEVPGDTAQPVFAGSASRATGTGSRLRIGLSPIAYRMPDAWPTPDAARFREYFDVLLGLVRSLREAGHEVVLFTSERTDRDVVRLVQQRLVAEGAQPLESVLPDRLEELLAALDCFDVVITSRLHGIILAHVLGKPAAALSYDRKVREHMKDMGQESYCLDIDSPELANAWAMTQQLIAARASAAASVRAALAPRRAQVVEQYAHILRMLRRGDRG